MAAEADVRLAAEAMSGVSLDGLGAGGADKEVEVLVEDDGREATDAERAFDDAVGAIEELMMDSSFQDAQDKFGLEHCGVFEDSDENKLEYTRLFEQYTTLIEGLLTRKLDSVKGGLSMEEFNAALADHHDRLGGEVLEMLLALGDFDEFKSFMLSFKAQADFEAGGASPEVGGFGGFLAPTVVRLETTEGDGEETKGGRASGGAGGVGHAGASKDS